MELAWNEGHKFLIVESDSNALIISINIPSGSGLAPCKPLRRIKETQARD